MGMDSCADIWRRCAWFSLFRDVLEDPGPPWLSGEGWPSELSCTGCVTTWAPVCWCGNCEAPFCDCWFEGSSEWLSMRLRSRSSRGAAPG